MDVQVQLAGPITGKPTSNGGTKFDIPLSNGSKPSTFDDAIPTKIASFAGQPFTARLEQKGKYLNIIGAYGPGEQVPADFAAAGQAVQTFPAVQAAPFVPTPAALPAGVVPFTPTDNFPPEATTRITKLSVIQTAYAAVSALFHGAGPEELPKLVEQADKLAQKLYADARSHEGGVQTAPAPQPVAAEPQAMAAFVAEQAGTPVVQVGTDGIIAAAAPAALPWAAA
jgi:hypothetical protein